MLNNLLIEVSAKLSPEEDVVFDCLREYYWFLLYKGYFSRRLELPWIVGHLSSDGSKQPTFPWTDSPGDSIEDNTFEMKIYVFERGFLEVILPKAVEICEFDHSDIYLALRILLQELILKFVYFL